MELEHPVMQAVKAKDDGNQREVLERRWHWQVLSGGGGACMVVMMWGQTCEVCPMVVAAFCGLVLVFGPKLVSYDAAGLPFGMVSEPRRRRGPSLWGIIWRRECVGKSKNGWEFCWVVGQPDH